MNHVAFWILENFGLGPWRTRCNVLALMGGFQPGENPYTLARVRRGAGLEAMAHWQPGRPPPR